MNKEELIEEISNLIYEFQNTMQPAHQRQGIKFAYDEIMSKATTLFIDGKDGEAIKLRQLASDVSVACIKKIHQPEHTRDELWKKLYELINTLTIND